MKRSWIIGLDIGGTFTDVVMVHPTTRAFHRFKCLTTPDDPARGALAGVDGVLAEAGVKPGEVAVTPPRDDARLQRPDRAQRRANGAGIDQGLSRCAQNRTREEIRHLRSADRTSGSRLSRRAYRSRFSERMGPDGSVLQPLERQSVLAVADAIHKGGAGAVAVCLLHSYMNPAHEIQLRDLLQEHLGAIPVSLSSEVLPEMREYERASTTAANAFVQPVIADYLERFVDGLKRPWLSRRRSSSCCPRAAWQRRISCDVLLSGFANRDRRPAP